MYELRLENEIAYQKLGSVLLVEGIALAEGTYTGLDGKTCFYSKEEIERAGPTLLGKPIVYPHTTDDGATAQFAVGFVTEVAMENGALKWKGYIYDPEVQTLVEQGMLPSVSAEIFAQELEPEDSVYHAKGLSFNALALTDRPACSACKITQAVPVQLEKESEREMETETQLAEKPSREDFFDWLKEQFKKAGVAEDEISKIIKVLKDAIKTPYPYPYPYPAPKKKEEKQEEVTVEGQVEELEELKAKLDEVIKEKQMVEKKYLEILESQKADLITSIKKLDKKFKEEELLKGVEDITAQIPILQSYLQTLERLHKTKLEVDESSELKERVQQELKWMFGTDNVEEVL